jgi:hypothetical protein
MWSLPQPVLVLGSMVLVATMMTSDWMNNKLYALILSVMSVPILIAAERIWTRRNDWLLEPKELA